MIYVGLTFLAIILYLSLSSLKLRLLFDETNRFAELSYTFLKVRLDFYEKTGMLYLFRIGLRQFPKPDIKIDKATETIREAVKKRPVTKESWYGQIDFEKVLYYMKKAYYPIRRIRIKRLDIDISDGFSDPYYTGVMYAYYTSITGMIPRLRKHIKFNPDFSADAVKIRGEGLVSLRIIHILIPVIQILTNKAKEYLTIPNVKYKKGINHV